MITVYTKPQCVQCEATKRHLNRLGIEYNTVDITEDTAALDKLISMGFQSAPVVITKNDQWSGYQPDKINKLADI